MTTATQPQPQPQAPHSQQPMSQADIRAHYEKQWGKQSRSATTLDDLSYSNPVEDEVLYPAYERLLQDLHLAPNAKHVLDVGSGSGRWIRYFLSRFSPALLVGMDYTQSSVDLLRAWHANAISPSPSQCSSPFSSPSASLVHFAHANIADPALTLSSLIPPTTSHQSSTFAHQGFDLINIANVLFHIPEQTLFEQSLRNLRALVAPTGAIVSTEYLPRATYRTNWMMVRSRYEFEAACTRANLRIAAVRAFSFFSNDPMGLDGPDTAGRSDFNAVRARMQHVLSTDSSPEVRQFMIDLFAQIERATLVFARERIAEIDLPSQKLVVLVPA